MNLKMQKANVGFLVIVVDHTENGMVTMKLLLIGKVMVEE